jgi:hypothetical protein
MQKRGTINEVLNTLAVAVVLVVAFALIIYVITRLF